MPQPTTRQRKTSENGIKKDIWCAIFFQAISLPASNEATVLSKDKKNTLEKYECAPHKCVSHGSALRAACEYSDSLKQTNNNFTSYKGDKEKKAVSRK